MVQSSFGAFSRLFERSLVDTAAPPQPDNWPMSVDQFVLGNYMRYSDIVLSRNEYNPLSWLIRRATRANFAHVGLVFLEPKLQYGWQSTYLIESVFAGVEVTDLNDYFKHPRLSVAIKRLNRDWMTDRIRRRVRGRMLDDIKAEYAFSTLFGLGRQLLFGVESAMRGQKSAVIRRRIAGKRAAKEFICSGFIQRGYAQGIFEFVRDGALPPSAMKDVMFDPKIAANLPEDWSAFTPAEVTAILEEFLEQSQDDLFAVTPRDLETNDAFEWAYVITRGKAYQVTSYADVCNLLGTKPIVA
jgi:hypothetical protein